MLDAPHPDDAPLSWLPPRGVPAGPVDAALTADLTEEAIDWAQVRGFGSARYNGRYRQSYPAPGAPDPDAPPRPGTGRYNTDVLRSPGMVAAAELLTGIRSATFTRTGAVPLHQVRPQIELDELDVHLSAARSSGAILLTVRPVWGGSEVPIEWAEPNIRVRALIRGDIALPPLVLTRERVMSARRRQTSTRRDGARLTGAWVDEVAQWDPPAPPADRQLIRLDAAVPSMATELDYIELRWEFPMTEGPYGRYMVQLMPAGATIAHVLAQARERGFEVDVCDDRTARLLAERFDNAGDALGAAIRAARTWRRRVSDMIELYAASRVCHPRSYGLITRITD